MIYFSLPFCGLEFDLQWLSLWLAVPYLGQVWLEVEAARGGKFFIAERTANGWEVWAGRLHAVADRTR